jgi:hypothetical protein
MRNNEHYEGPGSAAIPAAAVIIGSILTFVLLFGLHQKDWHDPVHPTAGTEAAGSASNH